MCVCVKTIIEGKSGLELFLCYVLYALMFLLPACLSVCKIIFKKVLNGF